MDNKVSEKAIWEGSIPSEDGNTQFSPFPQSQSQMMFCYKCNNVIPGDSRYCPYCQVELFTTCPKCGAKYSSQYPACSKCGTNRQEYLQAQRREQERKEAIERENRRQKEIQERKIQEEELRRKKEQEERERQERLKAAAQQAVQRQQKEAYIVENAKIAKTEEYSTVYSMMAEALKSYYNKHNNGKVAITFVVLYILDLLGISCFIGTTPTGVIQWVVVMVLGAFFGLGWLWCCFIILENGTVEKREKFILNYVEDKKGYNKDFLNCVIEEMRMHGGEIENNELTECCIKAYRKKYGLRVDIFWNSLLQ